jgi:multicomponent K+:H+ antiporter subunit E
MSAAPEPRRAGAIRRVLPRPWTALWLWLAWLLLNQTIAPGQVLLGAALALVLSRWPAAAADDASPARRPVSQRAGIAVRLGWIVLHDIVVANLQVAKLILGPREAVRPGFVWVPLDVRRPRSISLFAGIITMTPGTISAELSDDHRHLLVHALRVEDPAALAAELKARYETPIRELFE